MQEKESPSGEKIQVCIARALNNRSNRFRFPSSVARGIQRFRRKSVVRVNERVYRAITAVKTYSPEKAIELAAVNRNNIPPFQITSGCPVLV